MFAILDSGRPPGFGMPIANPLFRAQNTDGDELGPPHLEARQQGNPIPPPPFLSEIGCLGKLSRQLLLPLLPLKQILDLGQNWKATGEGPRHSYVSSEHISSFPRSFWGHSNMTSTLRWREFSPKAYHFADRLRECDM